MKETLPEGLLSRLSEFVDSRMALHFPRSRWGEMESKACSAAEEMGFASPVSFVEGMIAEQANSERMDALASHLTNGETYFWREPKLFEALEGELLPELILSRGQSDRRLRIWCAGCSTGEEAYSVAIALRRGIPSIDEWNVTVLATDINMRALRKAEAGLFGEWSFRNAPPWLAECFSRPKKDGKREILPEIRKMVSFEYLNLAEDSFPSSLNDTNAMDIVFCRNVLMYFSPERARLIIGNLGRALVEGGWLIVSACECSQALFSGFSSVQFPGATAYRKLTKPPPVDGFFSPETAFAVQVAPRAPPRVPAAVLSRASPMPASIVAPSIRELADAGHLAEALASCDAAISADRVDPRLHRMRATILQELNREDEAMAALKTSIYLDPESVSAYFTLGNLAQRGGDLRTEKLSFKNALALLGDSPDGEVLPETEGLTAGRLREIIKANMRIDASITEAV